jgi:hypothetical protein
MATVAITSATLLAHLVTWGYSDTKALTVVVSAAHEAPTTISELVKIVVRLDIRFMISTILKLQRTKEEDDTWKSIIDIAQVLVALLEQMDTLNKQYSSSWSMWNYRHLHQITALYRDITLHHARLVRRMDFAVNTSILQQQ